jgi:hypothetical protein
MLAELGLAELGLAEQVFRKHEVAGSIPAASLTSK